MHVQLKVSGEFACFTAPEMRVERVSLPVMTPSAARNILHSVFWKPEIRYEIDEISVLNPIEFISVRRNEIQDVISLKSVRAWQADASTYEPYLVDSAGREDVQGEHRTQRNNVILRNVAYVIQARLIVNQPTPENNPTKYLEMYTRRVAAGQCFRQPYLGIREFAARFEPPSGGEQPIADNRDLGIFLYDMDYGAKWEAPKGALFAPARLVNGVLDVRAMRENLYRRAGV